MPFTYLSIETTFRNLKLVVYIHTHIWKQGLTKLEALGTSVTGLVHVPPLWISLHFDYTNKSELVYFWMIIQPAHDRLAL